MIDVAFRELLELARSEISQRKQNYFERFPLRFGALGPHCARYQQLPLFQKYTTEEICEALQTGIAYFVEQGITAEEQTGPVDTVAALMLDSIMDAFAARRRDLPLAPYGESTSPLGDILESDYDRRSTLQGTRYIVGRRGDTPLVLVTACGIPLAVWSKLLADHSHGFRIIVVESRTSDLISGGMRFFSDMDTEVNDIIDVLDSEAISRVVVLAWCSGGRLAIELAARLGERAQRLVLLSVTLRGIQGVASRPNPFEDNMAKIFNNVLNRPSMAGIFAKTFEQQEHLASFSELDGDLRRASILFGLPAEQHALALLVPMLRADFLCNYARRMTADEAYPVNESLSRLGLPIALITGSSDTVVNNRHTCDGLKRWGPSAINIEIKGGAHYVHDLQYPYFRAAITEFVSGRKLEQAARITVESLKRQPSS
jgi:pimeloyl-ACP methyl ester carboxylesterase